MNRTNYPPHPHPLPAHLDLMDIIEQQQLRLSPDWLGMRITASGRPTV